MEREAVSRSVVERLLAHIGQTGSFELTAVTGGGNNRVYRIDGELGPFALKQYFRHPADPRDRLHAEYSFLRYAWNCGIRNIPEPFAVDRDTGLGLYQWLEGRKAMPEDIDDRAIDRALELYRELNQSGDFALAWQLPIASEACFSIAQHIHCVDRRLGNLQAIESLTPWHRETLKWVKSELHSAWERIKQAALVQLETAGIAVEHELPVENRCISPSDFGFHNALIDASEKLFFIDFEYAGWDDPAKFVCDFFCQVAVPVPRRYFDRCVESVITSSKNAAREAARIRLLLPIYRMKWCCILLNEFLPAGSARRTFAGGEADYERRYRMQLEKAQRLLHEIDIGD